MTPLPVNKISEEDFKSPFGITPDDIFNMLSPPNSETFKSLGYTEGIAKLLKSDLKRGLNIVDPNAVAIEQKDESHKGKVEGAALRRGNSTLSVEDSGYSYFMTKDDVEARRNVFGTNQMPEPILKSLWSFVVDAYQDKMLILLTVAAFTEIAIGGYKTAKTGDNLELIDGFAVLLAVLIVIVVTSSSDYQKQGQFRKLNDMSKSLLKSRVIRGGKMVQINTSELLVGDVCIVDTGDILPADGVFIKGYNLAIDESSLTGEPIQIQKDHLHDPFLLSGTKVLSGVGQMLVISTGIYSLNGRSILALEVEPEKTPLQEKLGVLADKIAQFGTTAAVTMVVVLLISYLVQTDLKNTSGADVGGVILAIIISGITLIVVAVPEGLPLAVTLALAHATVKMLKDNNLVRHLKACETMGNATTICSDKTGTLTLNQMTVIRGLIGSREFDRSKDSDGPKFKERFIQENSEIMSQIFSLACLSVNVNSTAQEETTETGQIVFSGSKTEVAILNLTKGFGHIYSEDRERVEIVEVYPFSSEVKSMSTVIKVPKDTVLEQYMGIADITPGVDVRFWLFVKGAAEIIFAKCDRYLDKDGKVQVLDESSRDNLTKAMLGYNDQALRTICVALRPVLRDPSWDAAAGGESGKTKCEDIDNLVMVGIFGILDPLRPEVPDAVKVCQRAGVNIRMVTGDSVATARAIARDAGILTEGGTLLEGHVFRKLSPAEMDLVLPKLQVLARSSPLDKQILVNRLKFLGETVAVTGDGTNDGPALKSADVGFSMGIAGTEVAKEASDIVLLDDNFASLVKAIIWGRSVYDSVRKFLQFQLTVNVSAVVLVFVTSLYTAFTGDKIPTPGISAVQLLWVNLIMDTMAALALATDPPSPSLLERKPSPRSDPILSAPMKKMIIGQGVYQIMIGLIVYFYANSWFPSATSLATTEKEAVEFRSALLFNSFVFCQIFNEVNSRSISSDLNIFGGIHKNFIFIGILVLTVILQAIIIQFGNKVFHVPSSGLGGYEWLVCIAIGFGTFPVGVLIRLLPDFDINLRCLLCGSKIRDLEEGASSLENPAPLDSVKVHSDAKRQLWRRAINKTTMQIRVIKAFKEPYTPGRMSSPGSSRTPNHPATFAPRVRRMSVTGSNLSNPDILTQSTSSPHSFSVVNALRGGRSTVSDFASIQLMDANEARSRGAPK